MKKLLKNTCVYKYFQHNELTIWHGMFTKHYNGCDLCNIINSPSYMGDYDTINKEHNMPLYCQNIYNHWPYIPAIGCLYMCYAECTLGTHNTYIDSKLLVYMATVYICFDNAIPMAAKTFAYYVLY